MKKSSFEIPQIRQSSISLPYYVSDKKEIVDDKKDFHLARNGKWSGTTVKSLMTCSTKGGKMQWGEEEKIKEFSSGIIKLIYEKYNQRLTGKYIETGSTAEMRYGTKVEPLILKIGGELLKDKGIVFPVKFKSFPNIDNAGATSDSALKKNDKVIATCEAKACTNWGTHYDRTFVAVDEKSKDFWQTQTQMIAWEVDTCYYLVAEPPKDINRYLYYDGDIMDLLDEFRDECKVSVIEVKGSVIHQKAIIDRITILEKVIDMAIDTKKGIKECYDDIIYGTSIDDAIEYVEDVLEDIEVIEPIHILPEPTDIIDTKNILDDLPF